MHRQIFFIFFTLFCLSFVQAEHSFSFQLNPALDEYEDGWQRNIQSTYRNGRFDDKFNEAAQYLNLIRYLKGRKPEQKPELEKYREGSFDDQPKGRFSGAGSIKTREIPIQSMVKTIVSKGNLKRKLNNLNKKFIFVCYRFRQRTRNCL